jgi:hypothetical protein
LIVAERLASDESMHLVSIPLAPLAMDPVIVKSEIDFVIHVACTKSF